MGSQKNVARALLFPRRLKTIFRNSRFAIQFFNGGVQNAPVCAAMLFWWSVAAKS